MVILSCLSKLFEMVVLEFLMLNGFVDVCYFRFVNILLLEIWLCISVLDGKKILFFEFEGVIFIFVIVVWVFICMKVLDS